MDIIDIILAKKKSTGAAAPLIKQAKEAVISANEAVDTVNDILDDAQAANDAANAANDAAKAASDKAQAAADTYDNLLAVTDASAIADFEDAFTEAVNAKSTQIDSRLDVLDEQVSTTATNAAEAKTAAESATSAAASAAQTATEAKEAIKNSVKSIRVFDATDSTTKYRRMAVTKGDDHIDDWNVEINYTTTGQHEDGAMTQKAITNALADQKTELETKINEIKNSGGGSGSGNISGNLGDAEPGTIVVVGDDGEIEAGDTTQAELIKTQIAVGTYLAKNAVGIEIDYENKTVNRIQESINYSAGTDFDKYPMFGGRRRCTVADDGTINYFYGENGFAEDGSVGQVMVYQPKCYYMRFPTKTATTAFGTKIQKEILLLSATKQSGFEVAPIFKDKDGNELDYVLLPAYTASAYNILTSVYYKNDEQTVDLQNDLLCSIAGVKPITGASQEFTVEAAQHMAENRGTGWQLTDMAFESLTQMLLAIEFGSLNIQSAWNKGITEMTNYTGVNSAAITGATSNLGSTTGMAAKTTLTHGATTEIGNIEGRSSISYRGFENPYGDLWRFIGYSYVQGNREDNGGKVYVNNIALANNLPNNSNWISAFGYDADNNWMFVPVECSSTTANSALPVGDYLYIIPNLSIKNCCVIGGKNSSGQYCGPFYYGMDYKYDYSAYSYGACIMHKPAKGTTIYNNNIAKWKKEVGGE